MSEAAIKAEIRNQIAEIVEFNDDSVVVDSWDFMDGSVEAQPFCRIETGSLLRKFNETVCSTYIWQVPIVIVKPFVEWDETVPALAVLRQLICEKMDTLGYQTVLGLGVGITEIRDQNPAAPVAVVVDANVITDEDSEVVPTYLSLPMFLIIEERL